MDPSFLTDHTPERFTQLVNRLCCSDDVLMQPAGQSLENFVGPVIVVQDADTKYCGYSRSC